MFYTLHFIALFTKGMFWSNWFFVVFATLMFTGIGVAIIYSAHHLIEWFSTKSKLKAIKILLYSASSVVGILFALGYWGNFTNEFSWDDKIFLLSSLWESSPLKTIIVSIPFFVLTLATVYSGIFALWVGLYKLRKETALAKLNSM